MCVCLSVSHFWTCWVEPECACTHTHRLCVCVLERELDGVHTPVFCYVQLARKWNLMLCQMLTDSQKPCSCGERGEGKRAWMEKERVRRDEIDNRRREKEREIQKKSVCQDKTWDWVFSFANGQHLLLLRIWLSLCFVFFFLRGILTAGDEDERRRMKTTDILVFPTLRRKEKQDQKMTEC